jgi:hypothetical protein
MKLYSFSGSANITDKGIKKHFGKHEPWQAISELIWNGLDATATEVFVDIIRKPLGGIEEVTIVDNGTGINFKKLSDSFDRFNDSLKKDPGQHGSHGRGRLSFHKISYQGACSGCGRGLKEKGMREFSYP